MTKNDKCIFKYGSLAAALLTVMIMTPLTFATIPNFLNIQGKLTDINDEPKFGEFTFTFRIYNTPTGGTQLWEETKELNTTNSGLFSTLLGSSSPLNLSFSEPYYLEVVADGELLTPRYTIASTSYSFKSNITENIAPNSTAQENFFVNRSLGINTTEVPYTLNVRGTANVSGILYADIIEARIINASVLYSLSTISCSLQTDASGKIICGAGGGGSSSGWTTTSNSVYNNTPNTQILIGTNTRETAFGAVLSINGDTYLNNRGIYEVDRIEFNDTGFFEGIGWAGTPAGWNIFVENNDLYFLGSSNSIIATRPLFVLGDINVSGTLNASIVIGNHSAPTPSVRGGIYQDTCAASERVSGITSDGRITCTPISSGSGANTTGFYLYNSTNTVFFNETQLNNTLNKNLENRTLGKVAGFTANSYNGNIISGGDIGHVAANKICNAEFPLSHFCYEVEILNTIVSGDYSYTGTYWMQRGAPGFTADANDCRGWTSSSNGVLGPFWNWDANAQAGNGVLTNCAQSKKLMCCR